jgi:hypothetical protein
VIPSTFLGLVLFVASLGPGYVFLATTERRRPRRDQSQLAEAVQMAVIGAMASGAAALAVLGTGVLDRACLSKEGSHYFLLEPLRGLGALLLFFLLAYLGAWLGARIWCLGLPKTHHPAATGWQLAFADRRSDRSDVTVLTIEMVDGRRVTGVLGDFTGTADDDRELVLVSPLAVQAAHDAEPIELDDKFLVLRESEIRAVSGRYKPGRRPGAESRSKRLKKRFHPAT